MNDQIAVEFAQDLRKAITLLIKKLRKESPSGQGLSLTERSTLALLQQHKSLLPGELAAMEMITNQSMSQVLNHLLELGYITRTVSQTDKRKINITLSVLGEETIAKYGHERDEWLARAISEACSPEEQSLFKQIIAPINKLVDFKL